MRVEVIPARQLTAELCGQWIEIQRAEPKFHSPFARPEFTQAVADVRSDVEVAILEDEGSVAGFFPFQRSRSNWGRPVGGKVSDLQAVVCRPETPWKPLELMQACRLNAWEFHQFHGTDERILPYATRNEDAVYMDLSRGYEAFEHQRRQSGSNRLKTIQKTIRQAESRVGPICYKPLVSDPEVFDTLLRWKSEQYIRTGGVDVFSFEWVTSLLRNLTRYQTPEFGTMLSALYIGDRLAAVDLALRSHEVRSEWFGTYDVELARYSPGILALVSLARIGNSLGIERVELGRNNLPYKATFASAAYPTVAGCIGCCAYARLITAGRKQIGRLARSPLLVAPARFAKRFVYLGAGRKAFA